MTRVTALLTAYNQSAYVRDAVRDLLAQDAEDLEIVLSDDCSTDGTFAILSEEARRYRGPHRVRAVRTPRNMGLNAHLNALIAGTQSDVLIPFAGDDRFRPDRVRKLVERLEEDGAWLVHSDVRCIGPDGAPVPPVHADATFYRTTCAHAAALSKGLFIGATAGWRRALFDKYGPLPENRAYEDLVLGFRAALEGAVSHVAEPLVEYRVGVGLSFNGDAIDRNTYRRRRAARLTSWRDVLQARRDDARTFGLRPDDPILVDIEAALQDARARCAFHEGLHAFLREAGSSPERLLRVSVSELNRRRLRRP